MADYTWPFSDTDARYLCEAFDEALEFNVELSVSRSGKVSTLSLPGARWRATMQFPDTGLSELVTRRQIEAFLASLRGGADRLLMWNPLTPQPLGTMRGTVTLVAYIGAGATQAQITGGVPAAGATLLRGDRIEVGGQRVLLTSDATANGSGVMTVAFQPAHRSGAPSGAAVTVTRPTTKYVVTQPVVQMPARGDRLPGFAVELIEDAFSTSGDPYWANVSLLLHCEGSNGSATFVDAKGRTVTTVGGAQISTAQAIIGSAAGYFDGSGDYLTVPSSLDFDVTGDFTIEFWIRPSANATYCIIGRRDNPVGNGWEIFTGADGSFYFQTTSGSPDYTQSAAGLIVANAWQHLAFTRSGTTVRIFRNGVLAASNNAVTGTLASTSLTIGRRGWGGAPLYEYSGYIDELRITKGVARYTANFTPPTEPFLEF